MDHALALQDVDPAVMAELEGKSVIEMIGEVLAAVARYLDRRLGGPGALRRLASIAVAFAVGVIVLLVRRQASADSTAVASAGNRLSGHLAHPPSAWAAP
ncbi:MAG: hypothetical protein MK060_16865 [Blastomonas sp.]|uniref:hypothetical protein n=1 Tax=Blastomonas sp. TaxID=1909299 RepID=UPI00406A88DE|nr:hypothetical protein [Blastomonas sp.]